MKDLVDQLGKPWRIDGTLVDEVELPVWRTSTCYIEIRDRGKIEPYKLFSKFHLVYKKGI